MTFKGVGVMLIRACKQFLTNRWGDKNSGTNLCVDDFPRYWQQLSEVLLANELARQDILFSHKASGPDFCITNGGKKIWVEVITPQPEKLTTEWSDQLGGDHPHSQIKLRWT